MATKELILIGAGAGLAYWLYKRQNPEPATAPASPPANAPTTPPANAPTTPPANAPTTPPASAPTTPPASTDGLNVDASKSQVVSDEIKALQELQKAPIVPHVGLNAQVKAEIDAVTKLYPGTPYRNIIAVNYALGKCTPFISRAGGGQLTETIVDSSTVVGKDYFATKVYNVNQAYLDAQKGKAAAFTAGINLSEGPNAWRSDILSLFLEQWYYPACRVDPAALGAEEFALAARAMLHLTTWYAYNQPVVGDAVQWVHLYSPPTDLERELNQQAAVNSVVDLIGGIGGAASFGVATPIHNMWADEVKRRQQESVNKALASWEAARQIPVQSEAWQAEMIKPAGFSTKPREIGGTNDWIMPSVAASEASYITDGDGNRFLSRVNTESRKAELPKPRLYPIVNVAHMFALPVNSFEVGAIVKGEVLRDQHRVKLAKQAKVLRAIDILRCQLAPTYGVLNGAPVNLASKGLYSYVTAEGVYVIGSVFPPAPSCKVILPDEPTVSPTGMPPRYAVPQTRASGALLESGGGSIPPPLVTRKATDGST